MVPAPSSQVLLLPWLCPRAKYQLSPSQEGSHGDEGTLGPICMGENDFQAR